VNDESYNSCLQAAGCTGLAAVCRTLGFQEFESRTAVDKRA